MKFKISQEIFEKFPSLRLGLVVAWGIDNQGESQEILDLIKIESEKIKLEYNLEKLAADRRINVWREAYKIFGAKPQKYYCSAESLCRMILGGVELRHINKIVDLYNYVSLKYLVPVGGDDIDKIAGDIILRVAQGNEPFTQLNSNDTVSPKVGEVVYADDKEVLCRRWNWRECEKSKMTEKTANVALVVEALAPIAKEELDGIIQDLGLLVKKFCGGKIATYILSSQNKEVDI